MHVAIKVVEKSKLNDDLKNLIQSEIKIMRLINHPNIVKCHEILEDENSIYIVMQLCQDGDLESKITKNGALPQTEALLIIKGVFQGLLYLSQMSVIHRDIKVANIFLHKGIAKIADFGFAMHNKDISIGSPIYMSPEGIKHNVYGPKTDIWAFGIFIYELLHAKTPYSHCTKQKQLKYNISTPLNWSAFKAGLSYPVKDLMLKCLEVNYEKRITFQKLLDHDFFNDSLQDTNALEKNSFRFAGYLSDAYEIHKERSKKLEAGIKTQNLSNQKSPYQRETFKNYCQRLQLELQAGNHFKNMENWKIKKQKHENDNRNQRNMNGLGFQSPYKDRKRAKSGEFTLTKDKKISLERKSTKGQHLNNVFNSRKRASPRIHDRMKSEAVQSNLLENYKTFYRPNKNEISIKFVQKNPIYDQEDQNLPTFGDLKVYTAKKSHQTPHRNELSFLRRPNISEDQKLEVSNRSHIQSFLRKHKNEEKFQSLNQNQTNIWNSNRSMPQKEFTLRFPEENVDCHMYLVHFSRLLYKLSFNLRKSPQLWEIRQIAQRLCLDILHQIVEKINSINFSRVIHSISLRQIEKTASKYISQYTAQIHSQSKYHTRLNMKLLNEKFEKELNSIFQKQIQSQKAQSTDFVRLMYLGWVYLSHFRMVLSENFMNEKGKGYWFEYNCKNAVKYIEQDIEGATKIVNMEACLKLKRMIQERQY